MLVSLWRLGLSPREGVKKMLNRVLRLVAGLVVFAAFLALCLPGGVVAGLVVAPFTAAAWSAVWSWNVLAVVVAAVVGGEVLHRVKG